MGFRNIHLEGLHGRFDASTKLSDLRLNDPRGNGEVDKKVIFFRANVMRANVLTTGLHRPHPDPLLQERETDGREGWDL